MNERMLSVLTRSALLMLLLLPPVGTDVEAAPEGQIAWAAPFSISPTFFDPAEYQGSISSMMTFYALHDALLKPMPGNAMAPGLAESWTAARDNLTYEFVLRKNVRFHNGEVMTADDVKFSVERYRGTAAKLLKEKIAAVEVVDPHRVRIRLKEPWPDFMTFFGTPATGAGWIVPKSYVLRVGDDGFKKAPVGAGPYRFVSFTPGVELVLEAHEAFWRKVPAVKRLVFRSVPDDTTRLTMLKRGEVDIAYNIRGPLAEEVERTPGLKLTHAAPGRHLLGGLHDRAVGPQVAMARPPRAAGRIARDRSTSDQPSRNAWVLESGIEHHSLGLRVRVARPRRSV